MMPVRSTGSFAMVRVACRFVDVVGKSVVGFNEV